MTEPQPNPSLSLSLLYSLSSTLTTVFVNRAINGKPEWRWQAAAPLFSLSLLLVAGGGGFNSGQTAFFSQ